MGGGGLGGLGLGGVGLGGVGLGGAGLGLGGLGLGGVGLGLGGPGRELDRMKASLRRGVPSVARLVFDAACEIDQRLVAFALA